MVGIISIIALFIVLGIVFSLGKGSFLIAGYNTSSKKEKEKYDEVALCKFMGKLSFFFAFAMLFQLADYFFPDKNLSIVTAVLIPAGAIFALVYVNTGGRFRKK